MGTRVEIDKEAFEGITKFGIDPDKNSTWKLNDTQTRYVRHIPDGRRLSFEYNGIWWFIFDNIPNRKNQHIGKALVQNNKTLGESIFQSEGNLGKKITEFMNVAYLGPTHTKGKADVSIRRK